MVATLSSLISPVLQISKRLINSIAGAQIGDEYDNEIVKEFDKLGIKPLIKLKMNPIRKFAKITYQ